MSRKEVHVEASGRAIRISSPDKVVFPDQGWTKLDVVEHFLLCGEAGLRGVYNRPVSLKRWTKGVSHAPFFVKRVPASARSVVDVRFPSARPGRMFLPLDVGDVIWIAQMNSPSHTRRTSPQRTHPWPNPRSYPRSIEQSRTRHNACAPT